MHPFSKTTKPGPAGAKGKTLSMPPDKMSAGPMPSSVKNGSMSDIKKATTSNKASKYAGERAKET